MENEVDSQLQPGETFLHQQTAIDYFHGQAPRSRVTLPYQIGLCVVLFMMIALPLIYIGLIVIVSWAVYAYGRSGVKFFHAFG